MVGLERIKRIVLTLSKGLRTGQLSCAFLYLNRPLGWLTLTIVQPLPPISLLLPIAQKLFDDDKVPFERYKRRALMAQPGETGEA